MKPEKWSLIIGYEDLYKISNKGNVYNIRKNKIHNQQISNTGHARVRLSKNGINKKHSIARLVAEHFLNKEDGRDCVNHKDNNKLNNHVENLEWCNKRELVRYSYITERQDRDGKYFYINYHKQSKSYRVRIRQDNKIINVGARKSLSDAITLRDNFIENNPSFKDLKH